MPVNKGGRPRKIHAETVEYLKLNMKRGTIRTDKEAKCKANELLDTPVSTTTIRRRLREAGLIAKSKIKRPALKPRHIKDRMMFVKNYKEWTIDEWKNVVWSDESKINRICSDGLR
jgi:hypothetical protein